MIAVADNLALEPSKNEFKIVSPVPSGSTVEMITQAPRDVRDDVRLRREKHRHGRRHAAVPRGARQRWGGVESTSNVQRFLAQYRPVIHQ